MIKKIFHVHSICVEKRDIQKTCLEISNMFFLRRSPEEKRKLKQSHFFFFYHIILMDAEKCKIYFLELTITKMTQMCFSII